MAKPLLLVLALLCVGGCGGSATDALPGGYSLSHGDRGKVWLQDPDGFIAHAGLVKRLYRDERRILLVAQAASYGGKAAPPYPMGRTCYVALLIDAATRHVTQIELVEAERLAADMSEVLSSEQRCF